MNCGVTVAEVPIDMGASWIHGSHSNPLTKLAQEFNLPFVSGGVMSDIYFADGKPSKSDYELVGEMSNVYESIQEHMEAAYYKLKSKDMKKSCETSMQDLWDDAVKSLKISSKYLNPSKKEGQLIQWFKSSTEQYEAADYSNLSCHSFDAASEFSGGDASILGGYGLLINKLSEGLNVLTKHRVIAIDYSKKKSKSLAKMAKASLVKNA
jgi:hypothetical protein